MKNKSVNIIDAIDDDKFLINKSIENAIQIFRDLNCQVKCNSTE